LGRCGPLNNSSVRGIATPRKRKEKKEEKRKLRMTALTGGEGGQGVRGKKPLFRILTASESKREKTGDKQRTPTLGSRKERKNRRSGT